MKRSWDLPWSIGWLWETEEAVKQATERVRCQVICTEIKATKNVDKKMAYHVFVPHVHVQGQTIFPS